MSGREVTLAELRDPAFPFVSTAVYYNPCVSGSYQYATWEVECANRRKWAPYPASFQAANRFFNLRAASYTIMELRGIRRVDHPIINLTVPHQEREKLGVDSYSLLPLDRYEIEYLDFLEDRVSYAPLAVHKLRGIYIEDQTLMLAVELPTIRAEQHVQQRYAHVEQLLLKRRKLIALVA